MTERDRSFIPAGSVETVPGHRIMGWAEVGSAAGYLCRPRVPDLAAFPLGGVSAAFCLADFQAGFFPRPTAFFLSRFSNDFLVVRSMPDIRGGRNCPPTVREADLAHTIDGRQAGQIWLEQVRKSAANLP
jgi:hypothetical protein